jgi:hypothetical protein
MECKIQCFGQPNSVITIISKCRLFFFSFVSQLINAIYHSFIFLLQFFFQNPHVKDENSMVDF